MVGTIYPDKPLKRGPQRKKAKGKKRKCMNQKTFVLLRLAQNSSWLAAKQRFHMSAKSQTRGPMPCEVWLVSQSRSRSKLQASQKRLQCVAARAVSPLSHAFALVLVRTSTVRGRALLREGQVSLSIHHPGWRASHGSGRGHPWLGECSPLQSAPSLSTAAAAAHSWLSFFSFCVFFPCCSHTCSHPLLLLFIEALAHRLQPTCFLFSSKAS
ncbi:hypothetical protein HDV63DRAFT_19257 [Trichoderma sp. SZMC 28014]